MFKTQFDEETKLWKGRGSIPLYNPKVSLAQVFLRNCLNYGPKLAQVFAKNILKTFEYIVLSQSIILTINRNISLKYKCRSVMIPVFNSPTMNYV